MSISSILLLIFLVIGLIAGMLYAIFPRQSRNVWVGITKKKDFCVIHLKSKNSNFVTRYNIVPERNNTFTINENTYIIRNSDAYHQEANGRLHFRYNEGNSMPVSFNEPDYVFYANEVHTSLKNNVSSDLFSQKKELAFTVAIIALVVSIFVSIYAIYEIHTLNNTLQVIYSNIPKEILPK